MDKVLVYSSLSGSLAATLLAAAAVPAMAAPPCTGPGAPTTTQTKCLTAIQIPGNPLRSYDISWVNPERREFYLADRSNAGIDVIDTRKLKFKRTIKGFVGIKLNATTGAVDNNHSGPDGVVSHGRWLYAGDGDSTLKVIDLNAPPNLAIKQTISTGGTTRLDEMALTKDGRFLLGANNAENPPFVTLFAANGDSEHEGDSSTSSTSNVTKILKITIANSIVPSGFDLAIEQPTWEERTKRFYVSVPTIANNPSGCNYGQLTGPITCSGGLLIIDPLHPTASAGAYNAATNTGVLALNACGPNGATVGPKGDLMLGCTTANLPSGTTTLIINSRTKLFTNVPGLTGSDVVWYNSGDNRYYTGSNRDPGGAKLGVVDARTRSVIEKIPQSSGSHSVAADSERNLIFVPQSAPLAVVGVGGDTTAVGAGICGSTNGCIAVYRSGHREDDDDEHGGDAKVQVSARSAN